jgi:RNA polymerase sigma-70 factor (ECF subfamily)
VGQHSATRATLLGRFRRDPTDPGAWAEFVTHYGRKIFAWSCAWGLQHADAWDVTQNVLLNLAIRLRDFEYDPDQSFHAWLKTVTHNAWQNFCKAQARHRGSGDSGVIDRLANVAARDDLARRLEEAFDQELFQEAVARVRIRVEPKTWEAFKLVGQEDWTGADAARHLGMKVGSVFVACSRVTRMLREEVSKLERERPAP